MVPAMLRRLGVPEEQQADLPEPRGGAGGGQRGKRGRAGRRSRWPRTCGAAAWSPGRARDTRPRALGRAHASPTHCRTPAAAELMRFVTTPRATQAMLRGAGVNVGRFRPSIHVTLWS